MNKISQDNFNIFYLWGILCNWKKRFLLLIVIGVLAGVLKGFLALPIYRSTAVVVLPETAVSGSVSSAGISSLFSDSFSSVDTIMLMVTSERMRQDILKKFSAGTKDELKFWISIYRFKGNSAVLEVKAMNPGIAKNVADFCIFNLDSINADLNITSQRPVVKILDAPEYGKPVSNNMIKGATVGCLFGIICGLIWLFIHEYIRFKIG